MSARRAAQREDRVNQLFDESGSDEELEASPAAGSSDEAEPASSGEDVGDDADPVPPPRCAGAPVPPPFPLPSLVLSSRGEAA
jgi:hypothetical protein